MDIWDMIADQRHQLVAILQNLNEEQWHTPSLCTEWTVRDVVGHLVTPFELGIGKMFLRLIGNGFNIDKTLMKAAQQLARRPTSELVSVLRANAQTRWTPPGIGPEAPLTDILILYFPLSESEEQATSGKPSGRVRVSCLPST
jgi:uncharacterized protein (TIGR03083 family)